VRVIYVKTAQQMKSAVLSHFKKADLVIKAAAVADYRPRQVRKAKIKKSTPFFSLELERTPDILEELGKQKKDKLLIGFAAETEDLVKNAKIKLKEKNLDLIVANDLTLKGSGMGSDTNIAKLLFKDGTMINLPRMKKEELAEKILDQIKKLRAKRGGRK
ncbi:MAG: bifunctional 4'-phosphopantothenoylcysteine decarboxylase/phosphopantothenoylcysteine synthetase, partial [Armatimonadetes bacterium CG07_land_8_20_14_0_80_40_9]